MAVDRGTLILGVIALYGAACVLPAVQLREHGAGEFHQVSEGAIGFKALLLGWCPPSTVAWSANPVLLAGLVCYGLRRYDAAFRCGVVASLAGLTTWFLMTGEFERLLVGYYLWQASFLGLTMGAFCAQRAAGPSLKTRDSHDL